MDQKETKLKEEVIPRQLLTQINSEKRKPKTSLNNLKQIIYESLFSFLSLKENLTIISKLNRKIKNFILSRKIFQLLKLIKTENLFSSMDELFQLPNLIETNEVNSDSNLLLSYLKFYSESEKDYYLNYILKHKLKKYKILRIKHQYEKNFGKLLPVLKKNKTLQCIGLYDLNIVQQISELLNDNISIQAYEIAWGTRHEMVSNLKINCAINLYLQNISSTLTEYVNKCTEGLNDQYNVKKIFKKIILFLKRFLQVNLKKALSDNLNLNQAISLLNYKVMDKSVLFVDDFKENFEIPIDPNSDNNHNKSKWQNNLNYSNTIIIESKNNFEESDHINVLTVDSDPNCDIHIEKVELEIFYTLFFLMMKRCNNFDRGPSFYLNELGFFPNVIITDPNNSSNNKTNIKFKYTVRVGEMDFKAFFTSDYSMDYHHFRKVFEKIEEIELQKYSLSINFENKIDLDLSTLLKKIKKIEFLDTVDINNFSLLEGDSDLNSIIEIEQMKNFNSRLKRITLNNNKLTDRGYGLLMKLIPRTSILIDLKITNNLLENINSQFLGCKLDAKFDFLRLKELNLANNRLNDCAADLIFTKFNMPLIEKIDLSYNKISYEMDSLFGEKKEKQQIHLGSESDLISIKDNLLSELHYLPEKTEEKKFIELNSLHHLYLNNNSIGDLGLFNFLNSFKTDDLKNLDLSCNKIKSASAFNKKKFDSNSNNNLKTLNLNKNPINDITLLNLIKNDFIRSCKRCILDEIELEFIKIEKYIEGDIQFTIRHYDKFFSKFNFKFENLYDSFKSLIKISRERDTKDYQPCLGVSVLKANKTIFNLLNLSTKSLNDESLFEFFYSLTGNENKIDYSLNNYNEIRTLYDEVYFIKQIRHSKVFEKLDNLDLSKNKLSTKSLHLIMNDLQMPNLKVLNLNNAFDENNQYIDFDINKVFEIVFPMLENLDISNNKCSIVFDDFRFFSNKKQKLKFKFTQNQIDHIVRKPIKKLNFNDHIYNCKEIFPFFSYLKNFLFENNHKNLNGKKEIRFLDYKINLNDLCEKFYDLNEINLTSQKINDKLVLFIFSNFNLKNLSKLFLDKNEITMDSEFYQENLKNDNIIHLPKLLLLSICDNKISNSGLVNIFMNFKLPKLINLKLRNNRIDNKNDFKNQIKKNNVKSNMESLIVLDISKNSLDDCFRDFFASLFEKLRKIKV